MIGGSVDLTASRRQRADDFVEILRRRLGAPFRKPRSTLDDLFLKFKCERGFSAFSNVSDGAELLSDRDREKSKRVMQAMLKMKKIDISALKRAAEQIKKG